MPIFAAPGGVANSLLDESKPSRMFLTACLLAHSQSPHVILDQQGSDHERDNTHQLNQNVHRRP